MSALPVILLSAILQTGYSISLFKAYDQGQLSSLYPVARGSAPVFIFILSYVFFDPEIPAKTFVGILLICAGLVAYSTLAPLSLPASIFHKMILAAHQTTD